MDERHDESPDDEPARTTPEPDEADAGVPEDVGDQVGDDNIREGRVGGLMGGPRQSQGQGGG